MADAVKRITFAEIIAPIEPARFLAEYWTREAVHLRHEGRTFDEHFSWEALDTILNAGDIAFPKIKVSRRDQPVPPEQFTVEAGGQRLVDGRSVLDLLAAGASFGITGADSHWAPLRAVVDSLYDALLESVHTNVYCSPANTQGFQCHFDLHEVFVLQIGGEKHWRVFRPTTEAPVSSWRAEDSPHATTEPYLDVILGPGDVLYVPRGHWHYAIARSSISLHVTVGVTCRKGMAFLDWLTGELLQECAWRRNLPLLTQATSQGSFLLSEGGGEWAAALRQSIADKLAEPNLFERFCKDSLGSVHPIHNVSLPPDPLAIEAWQFERPPGRRHYVTTGPNGHGGLTINVAGAEIEVEEADAHLLTRIFDTDVFTIADIRAWKPDVVTEEAAALVGELTRSGFLIAKPRRP